MKHLFSTPKAHRIVRNHKRKIKGLMPDVTEDIIIKGRQYQDLLDKVSPLANRLKKTPECVIEELFESAIEYRTFLLNKLPARVTSTPSTNKEDNENE